MNTVVWLLKVVGCQWKSLPTWLVVASHAAWHFFTHGVFKIEYPRTGRLLWQLSGLLQNFLTTLSMMLKYCLEISYMYIYISVKLFICLVWNYMNDNEIYYCRIVTGSYCSWCSFYSHSWGEMCFCFSTFKTPLLEVHTIKAPYTQIWVPLKPDIFYMNWPFVLI